MPTARSDQVSAEVLEAMMASAGAAASMSANSALERDALWRVLLNEARLGHGLGQAFVHGKSRLRARLRPKQCELTERPPDPLGEVRPDDRVGVPGVDGIPVGEEQGRPALADQTATDDANSHGPAFHPHAPIAIAAGRVRPWPAEVARVPISFA
jgi:hypothetical protein